MTVITRGIAAALIALLMLPVPADAQTIPEVWRSFAQKIEPGTEIKVRLRNGQRFNATFISVRDDAVMLQPKVRRAVPVQPVAYEEIVSLELRTDAGVGAGRAAAIGVASGVGAFFAMILIVFAAVGD